MANITISDLHSSQNESSLLECGSEELTRINGGLFREILSAVGGGLGAVGGGLLGGIGGAALGEKLGSAIDEALAD